MTATLPIGTRTCVPRLPAPWVRRARLNARVSAVKPGDVMLVAAFAGSGKTTFLADWYTNDREIEGAWLSLDARDNAPGRLVGLIAHALGLEIALDAPRRTRRGDALVVDRIMEELDATGTPRVLVLDDVHELTAPDALRTLDHLVHHASHSLAIVLSTRADPPLPLSRLMMDGRLQQIRMDELALSLGETGALFAAHGLTLLPAQVASLHERTRGWAAGLRLAALALEGERDPSQFVADTVGSEAVMSEYLMHEVLQRLPEDLQRFLLRTSVAQPLTVELAGVLSDDPDPESKLADLEHTGLFVTRSDQAVSLYRFHSLFRALLHARLRHTEPALERELSARAARWFDANDMPAEAETHAFAAGEWKLGGTLACTRWVHSVLLGSVSGVDVDLPLHAPRADVANLSLIAAIDAVSKGERRDATMWRTRVDSLVPIADDEPVLRVTRLLLDVLYARAFGPDTRSVTACRTLREIELGSESDTALLHAIVRLREAEILLETDEDEGTLRSLLDARSRASRAAAPWIVAECDSLIALISAVRGRLDVCDTLFPPVVDDTKAADGSDTRRLARALCDAQRGRLQSARVLLAAEPPSASAPHAVRVGLEEAARRMEIADGVPRDPGTPSALAIHVRVALGSIDDAPVGTPEHEVALARMLLLRSRYAQIIDLLERFADGHDLQTSLRTRIEALTLVAVAADGAGDAALALSALRRALDLAAPADLRAPFLAYAVQFRDVIDRYGWQLVGETRYAVGLVDDLNRDELPAFMEPLTERERVVLEYLPSMMSNAEIAQQMLISVNTVKTHLKAVYRKLGVERRRDAVVRARQLEML
jgi:LuxR family maltose regulon positive regulatory protein